MNKTNSYNFLTTRLNALKDEINSAGTENPKINNTHIFWSVLRGEMPKNALKESSDGAGGYLVPDDYEQQLIQGLENENVLRKISTVIKTKYDKKIPTVIEHSSAAWVEEGQQIVVSDDRFGQVTLSAYKVGTLLLISDELLEDAIFNMEEVILNQFASRIGKCEEEAFISGDGNSKPIGILTQAPVGTVSAEAGKLAMDDATDLYHSVSTRYRQNAVWLMSEDAFRTLRKVKNAQGRNIWEPSFVAGEPDKLLGRPVYFSDFMPSVSAGSKPILFGDFSYYLIGDRGKRSIKRLVERYADKGQVGFLASQCVDAKLVLPEAIQALKIKE